MPLALDLVGFDGPGGAPLLPPIRLRLAAASSVAPAEVIPADVAPADVIPAQSGPCVTVSLTEGCEVPLEALKAASTERAVRCHPCDEAVVLLLLARARRDCQVLRVSATVPPGTLRLG